MNTDWLTKWVKWETKKDFCPYDDILLDKRDYKAITSFLSGRDIFDKLQKITEYRLAMELSKKNITIEEFDGAMAYGEYLKKYFIKTWQENKVE